MCDKYSAGLTLSACEVAKFFFFLRSICPLSVHLSRVDDKRQRRALDPAAHQISEQMYSPQKLKSQLPDFQDTGLTCNGKRVVNFSESCAVSALKGFVHTFYLESRSVWLASFEKESPPTAQQVWICKFEWDQDSFCILNPHGKASGSPEGVVLIDINDDVSVRVGLAWSFVERQQVKLRCFFLGSDFSREANFPDDNNIFRFNALLDQSAKIVDPHFDGCRIPPFERSSCRIGGWAPEGEFNYDIRRNSVICLGKGELIANNCEMAVFEQLKTAGYIAFANFLRFCTECEVPEDLVQLPTSTLDMNPTTCKKFFAGTVHVVDCRVALEWQSDRAGRTRRVTLDLQCNSGHSVFDDGGAGDAPCCTPPVCHVTFGLTFCTGDAAVDKVHRRGHVLVDSAPEVESGLHTASADSRY